MNVNITPKWMDGQSYPEPITFRLREDPVVMELESGEICFESKHIVKLVEILKIANEEN